MVTQQHFPFSSRVNMQETYSDAITVQVCVPYHPTSSPYMKSNAGSLAVRASRLRRNLSCSFRRFRSCARPDKTHVTARKRCKSRMNVCVHVVVAHTFLSRMNFQRRYIIKMHPPQQSAVKTSRTATPAPAPNKAHAGTQTHNPTDANPQSPRQWQEFRACESGSSGNTSSTEALKQEIWAKKHTHDVVLLCNGRVEDGSVAARNPKEGIQKGWSGPQRVTA